MGTLPCSTSGSWSKLPEEIIQSVGTYLNAQSWAAARQTCRSWKSITGSITLLEIDLERNAHRWMMVLTSVARMFPRLNSVVLLIGSRITPVAFAERMASLAITSIKVQELELRFVYGSRPQLGGWLDELSAVTQLQHLRVLRLAGGATPSPKFFSTLRSLRHLATLEVLPGVYGQLHELDADLVNASLQDVGDDVDAGLGDAHLEAVAALPCLRNLTVKASPGDCTPSGLLSLSSHGLLSRLEQLCLFESELPSSCLAAGLRGANKLTNLHLGLRDVENLAPLATLPKLQALHLDGVGLPSPKDLVYAAALGNIAKTGSGAITGLCLLDQVIGGPLQLSALSLLSSLSELVIMHPMAERVFPDGDQDLDDDASDPLVPQQQLPLVIDLACLSGLSRLKLLQIDLRDLSIEPEAPMLEPPPLHLTFSAAAVQQLAGSWKNLVTLDLNGFTPELLPDEAVVGFNKLQGLEHLSLLNLNEDGVVQHGHGEQVAPAAAAAGGAGVGGGVSTQRQVVRRVGWWQLPMGLRSLCLSHFDLTCGSDEVGNNIKHGTGSISSSTSVDVNAAQPGPKFQTQSQEGNILALPGTAAKAACTAVDASRLNPTVSICGSSSCCLATPPQAIQPESAADRASPSSLKAYLSPRVSPTKSLLGPKRRRDSGGNSSAAVDAAQQQADVPSPPDKHQTSSSSRLLDEGQAAALLAAGTTDSVAAGGNVCPCAVRVAAQFSSLQSLWLERCTIPRNFLRLLLPSLTSSLESLALLHVSGTSPDDLRLVSGLTSLTSLRLVPEGHGLSGLSGLLPLRHLKRLTVRLSHLQKSDIGVLPQLRSLYCLTLYRPTASELTHSAAAGCGFKEVKEVVSLHLPYCDVEVHK